MMFSRICLFIMLLFASQIGLAQNVQELFDGVTYIRDERSALRPMVIHVVLIDLQADGVGFLVTPSDDRPDGYDYTATTTTEFVETFDVQIAINGDFFGPVRDDGNKTEDGVNAHGLTILDNVTQTNEFASTDLISTMYITPDNVVTFNDRPDYIAVALSSKHMLVVENTYVPVDDPDEGFINTPHPRSAIGLSEDGQTLILMLVDGRQPDVSEGATLPELATFLREYGATTAMNLDGGGSASLAILMSDGQAMLLNTPVNYHEVNVERPIANHLGIYAKPLD